MSAPKRHWFRFWPNTWIVFAILVTAYGPLKVVERRLAANWLESRGALVVTWSDNSHHDPPAILRAFGATPVQWIEIHPRRPLSALELSYIAGCFPEADIPDRPVTFWDILSGPQSARE